MGQSTDGQICFGMPVEEEAELPWGDDDIEDWWMTENGYQPIFEMFTPAGDWIGGKEWPKGKKDEYYEHRKAFKDAHPIPVELVNTCSGDYPMWIIAVPSSVMTASRGTPELFIPEDLTVSDAERQALYDFLAKYDIEGGQVGWYLSSYWG